MIGPELQSVAQIAIGRTLNSLPEGLLIVLFAGAMLRLLPRQNSGTRFAVWFVALLAVAGLPLIGGVTAGHSPTLLAAGAIQPLFTLPGRWGVFLLLAWVPAALVAILHLVIGMWRLRALRSSCVPIDVSELDAVARRTLADFSSARSVTLATSERLSVPAAIGFFKPMIVVPAWALRELTSEELNIILLHEFAHLRRWDAWTNLLQKIVRAVFLFNPAVWWIENRLSLEREMACDDRVLAETANPRGYAKCLIALLERSVARRGWAMAQAAVRRAREASLRLARILDVGRPHTRNVWKPALGLVGAFSLLCLVVLPSVPQFVAFAPSTRAIQTDDAQPALLSQSQISGATVIPAALHQRSSSLSSPKLKKVRQRHVAVDSGRPPQYISEHVLEQRPAAPEVIAARASSDTEPNAIDTVAVEASESVVPAPDTLLIVRTAQRVGPNAWVWTVSVWRVTWVNPAKDAMQSGAVANKT
jgi:beta-lactamase regulating signal transducer with metallopeptidase domain